MFALVLRLDYCTLLPSYHSLLISQHLNNMATFQSILEKKSIPLLTIDLIYITSMHRPYFKIAVTYLNPPQPPALKAPVPPMQIG